MVVILWTVGAPEEHILSTQFRILGWPWSLALVTPPLMSQDPRTFAASSQPR